MKKPMIIAPLLAITMLSFIIVLADRMTERAAQDRFSFYDPSATIPPSTISSLQTELPEPR